MKIFRNKIKLLFIPALILWITAGTVLLISPWYYGIHNNYRSIAYILIAIGLYLTVVERYLKRKVSKKELIGTGFTFLFAILVSLISMYFW